MHFLLQLHTDLFIGLPGMLFLIAIVSGAVVHAPYMRELDFGTVRRRLFAVRHRAGVVAAATSPVIA